MEKSRKISTFTLSHKILISNKKKIKCDDYIRGHKHETADNEDLTHA